MPLNIVLVEPEIPQNTGNIARTCAATGITLHLVHPLGFTITDKHLKRAGLDYWKEVSIVDHLDLDAFLAAHGHERLWLSTTKGERRPDQVAFQRGDWLVFGKETAGLPEALIRSRPHDLVRLPMRPGTRSLNLSNAVAVMAYEALRQLDWPGLTNGGPR